MRPKQRDGAQGGARFRRMLKRTTQVVSYLLFLFLLLFVGHRVYAHLLADSSFRIREVEVQGNRKIPRETLLSLTSIEKGSNLFAIRLEEMVQRLESHPWIESVQARKVLPDRLVIRVKERKPIAILQLEDLHYIDARGIIFSAVDDRDGYDYPFLTGVKRRGLDKDPEEGKYLIMKALELLLTADGQDLFPVREISEVHADRISGINFFTRVKGMEVRMGWEGFAEKLRRLSMIQGDLQKRGISAISIDCRDPNRIVVMKTPAKRKQGRR